MRSSRAFGAGLAILLVLGVAAAAVAAEGPPFALAVKRDKVFGASGGTLTFSADTVEFRTAKASESRSWRYEDLQQIQVRSPRRIDILTFEDQGKLKFGTDRTYELTLSEGEVPHELVSFLLQRVDRPLVIAVIPPACCESSLKVDVKHERQGKGSEGELAIHHGALVYDTPREGEARFWRFADLDSVLPLDRYRLQVTAREGGGLRPFVFQLKSEVPEGFYDALWAEVNGRTR